MKSQPSSACGYCPVPKGHIGNALFCACSRCRSLSTRLKTRLATASGSWTFAAVESSAAMGVRRLATSAMNAVRSAAPTESTTLEGQSFVDPPSCRNA